MNSYTHVSGAYNSNVLILEEAGKQKIMKNFKNLFFQNLRFVRVGLTIYWGKIFPVRKFLSRKSDLLMLL